MKPHSADRFMWCVLMVLVGLPALAASVVSALFLANVAWGAATGPASESSAMGNFLIAIMLCICACSGFVFFIIGGATLRAFLRAKSTKE